VTDRGPKSMLDSEWLPGMLLTPPIVRWRQEGSEPAAYYLFSEALSFIMAFAGTVTAIIVAAPRVVEAQESLMRSEQFTLSPKTGRIACAS
jgi:hypothetical protein